MKMNEVGKRSVSTAIGNMIRLEKFEGWSGHPEWVSDVMHVILNIFISGISLK